MMFSHLRKLQNKSEHVRKSIALVGALLITTPILFLWVATFQFQFSSQQPILAESSRSPFSLISDAPGGLVGVLSGIGGVFRDIKMQLTNFGDVEVIMNVDGASGVEDSLYEGGKQGGHSHTSGE